MAQLASGLTNDAHHLPSIRCPLELQPASGFPRGGLVEDLKGYLAHKINAHPSRVPLGP